MNESETIHIPVAIAVIFVSVAAVLLISLAITVVFFDKAGYLRRLKRSPRVLNSPSALVKGATRRPAPARRTSRTEPWGKR